MEGSGSARHIDGMVPIVREGGVAAKGRINAFIMMLGRSCVNQPFDRSDDDFARGDVDRSSRWKANPGRERSIGLFPLNQHESR